MPDPTPAESILGPITPICCTEPGCHWACHGVPDKYADSRARIVREHLAAEHAPTPEPSPTPAWVDGDPLMEATASAVWEQCRTENSIVVDDPRNIAAVAATVARQLLGTTTSEGPADEETDEEREQREDREEAARLHAAGDHQYCDVTCETAMPTEAMRNFVIAKGYPGTAGALDELLRRAAAAPPAPVDRAALTDSDRQFLTFALDLAFDEMVSTAGFTDEDHAALEKFRALATPPAAPAAPEELTP